jgi:phage shock protein A
VKLRMQIGRIDTQIDGLRRQQTELNARADETRRNLEVIRKDPAAAKLRAKLRKRLDEFTRDADKLGRTMVELNSTRLERKIDLEDQLQDLDLRAGRDKSKPSK